MYIYTCYVATDGYLVNMCATPKLLDLSMSLGFYVSTWKLRHRYAYHIAINGTMVNMSSDTRKCPC